MRRRHVLAGLSTNALALSGCLGSVPTNQAPDDADSPTATPDCWDFSEREGFTISSGYNKTASVSVTVYELDDGHKREVFRDSFTVDSQEYVRVQEAVFTSDTQYRVVGESLGKTVSKQIDGGDKDWRLRRTISIILQQGGDLAIGSSHRDGPLPPKCDYPN